MKRRVQFLVLALVAVTGIANASWYDDYEEGVKAARAGNHQRVIDLMTKAIKGNPNESNNARTYGAIFINYKPYYYRGIAYLNVGKNELAIPDLEKTMGPGTLDLGPVEVHLKKAKEVAPTPLPPSPTPPSPPPPTGPIIDPNLRSRAEDELRKSNASLTRAQERNATGAQEYKDALQQYRDANRRLNAAASNDDLRAVINMAGEVTLLANSAQATVIITPVPPPPTPPGPDILATTRRNLRSALESYYEGDFVNAERKFKVLSQDLPTNPWIWAYLGASQWSRYAFETNNSARTAAISSFKKAREAGWRGGLPEKYFSRRIRNAFDRNAS